MAIPRIIIYPKDIQLIVGLGYRASVRLYKKVCAHFRKEPHQFLTVSEFCAFTGLKISDIEMLLK